MIITNIVERDEINQFVTNNKLVSQVIVAEPLWMAQIIKNETATKFRKKLSVQNKIEAWIIRCQNVLYIFGSLAYM